MVAATTRKRKAPSRKKSTSAKRTTASRKKSTSAKRTTASRKKGGAKRASGKSARSTRKSATSTRRKSSSRSRSKVPAVARELDAAQETVTRIKSAESRLVTGLEAHEKDLAQMRKSLAKHDRAVRDLRDELADLKRARKKARKRVRLELKSQAA